jgi:hypothetical protein
MRAGYLDMKRDDFRSASPGRMVQVHRPGITAMSEPANLHRADNVIDLDVYRAVRAIRSRRAAARRPVAWAPMPQGYAWAPWLGGTVAVMHAPVAGFGRRSSG